MVNLELTALVSLSQVVESLDTQWQRDTLARALSSLHGTTLSHLQQGEW